MITFHFVGTQIPPIEEQEIIKKDFLERYEPFKKEMEERNMILYFNCPLKGEMGDISFSFGDEGATIDFVSRVNQYWEQKQGEQKS